MLELKPQLLKRCKRGRARKQRRPGTTHESPLAVDATCSVAWPPIPTAITPLQRANSPDCYRTHHPSRRKRAWSEDEDQLFIQILLELHSIGKYRADRGFKPGLYTAVEKEMERRMLGAGIKTDPHIYSRVKILKSHYNIIIDMLYGNTSGFGWDG